LLKSNYDLQSGLRLYIESENEYPNYLQLGSQIYITVVGCWRGFPIYILCSGFLQHYLPTCKSIRPICGAYGAEEFIMRNKNNVFFCFVKNEKKSAIARREAAER
jgi:hypothetical protein